ncbi:MAG: hypothetical protein K2H64_04600 [Desulfovibrio sp.]|nr:hypothetical protein [Desulfovibrio sp.]
MKKQIENLIKFALVPSALAVFLAGSALAMASQSPGSMGALESPNLDMQEAARDLERAGQAFSAGATAAGQLSGQQSDQMSWSDFSKGKVAAPRTARPEKERFEPPLVGSPETGYAGTWTDPATGDIVTSVIAPAPRQTDSYSQTPIVIQPDIGSWNYSGSASSQTGNYQWPAAPGSPGYPESAPNYNVAPPPPSQYYPQHPGGYYPPTRPNPPAGVQPGYRPLRPNPVGGWQQGGANGPYPPQGAYPGGAAQPARPSQPEFNIPGWKPFPPSGNRPYPGGVQPEYNIPGWKPFPPAGNQAYPPRGGGDPGRPAPRGAW